jgi:hypothetical protein
LTLYFLPSGPVTVLYCDPPDPVAVVAAHGVPARAVAPGVLGHCVLANETSRKHSMYRSAIAEAVET